MPTSTDDLNKSLSHPAVLDWINAEYKHEITECLRFKFFDLGRLLLRNDHKSFRNDVWRSTASRFFWQAQEQLSSVLWTEAINTLDYHLPRIGFSVLDPDQHDLFSVLLNQDMHQAYESLTCRLIQNGQSFFLPEFQWVAGCGKNSKDYTFAVVYSAEVKQHPEGHWYRKPFVHYTDYRGEPAPTHPKDIQSLPTLR